MTTLNAATETVSDLGNAARQSIEDLGRSAGERIDDARDETGRVLHAAAASVRETGREGSAALNNMATGAADRLDATASYVEDHDVRTMLRRFGLRHLTGTLMVAAAAGFLAGSFFGRATHSCGKNA